MCGASKERIYAKMCSCAMTNRQKLLPSYILCKGKVLCDL